MTAQPEISNVAHPISLSRTAARVIRETRHQITTRLISSVLLPTGCKPICRERTGKGAAVHETKVARLGVTAAERISLGEVHRGAEPGGSIKRAIAEARLAHLRPWEIIASENLHLNLVAFDPESRVALEMAATEEAEQIDLSMQAREMETSVRRERKVAAIADDLLLPDEIQGKLVALRLAEGREALDPDEQVDHPAETQVSTLSENQDPVPTYKQPPTTFDELIAPFPARVRESATTLRTLILEAMPEAQENVSGGQSFGTALYSLVTPTKVACGLQPASSHCKLYLHHLQPDDAAGLKLEGSGKNVRHVKVHSLEAAQQVETAGAIARAWLRAGVK